MLIVKCIVEFLRVMVGNVAITQHKIHGYHNKIPDSWKSAAYREQEMHRRRNDRDG